MAPGRKCRNQIITLTTYLDGVMWMSRLLSQSNGRAEINLKKPFHEIGL